LLICLLSGMAAVHTAGLAGEPQDAAARLEATARRLLEVERHYFDERRASQWEAIYARQHPRLQERITLPFFVNRNGRAAYDTPDVQPKPQAPTGPLIVPAPPPSDRILPARDILGHPTERKYRFYANPWVHIERWRFETVSVSPDGRYGKVDVQLDVTETLPPQLFKMDVKIPEERVYTDYWENIEGEWRVALMVHQPSISGSRWTEVFIPNELEQLNQIEWVAFDPGSLNPSDPAGGK